MNNLKIAIIISGNVRKSIEYSNIPKIINKLNKKNYLHLYGFVNKKY